MRIRSLRSVALPVSLSVWVGCPGPAADKGGESSEARLDETGCHPEVEIPCDGLDQDCDGEDGNDGAPIWYADEDGDGWGEDQRDTRACERPEGTVEVGGDCDDGDPDISPGATERCDGVDDDCDGVTPSDELDEDEDGQASCEGDCDDAEPSALSGFIELCGDGIDNDCEGTIDEACATPSGCAVLVLESTGSIQEAIDAASAGDTICVGPGTYAENLDFGGAEVSVVGIAGGGRVILGTSSGTIVRFDSAEAASTLLRGVTVRGGYDDNGGCIYISGASPTLEDLVVEGCRASYGGGIYVVSGSPTITNTIVQDNDCHFSLGSAVYGFGGGLYLDASDVLLDNVIVQGNEAETSGGGILMQDSSLTLLHTVLRENNVVATPSGSSNGGGGLLSWDGSVGGENVLILDNAGDSLQGGGMRVIRSNLTLTNAVIAGNSSHPPGGGLGLVSSEVTLTNVVLWGNASDEAFGGGIYATDSTVTVRYSSASDNDPDDYSGVADPTGSDGNISVDPDFSDGVGHLSESSSLIDAGDPALLDPDGTRSDIGARGGPEAGAWDLDGDGYPAWWRPGAYDAATSPDLDCDDEDAAVYPGSGC